MAQRRNDKIFKHFKQYNFDMVWETLDLKPEYADWLFHVIHNDFNQFDLCEKFDINLLEANAFMVIMGNELRTLREGMLFHEE